MTGLHFIADVACRSGLADHETVEAFVTSVVQGIGLTERNRIVDVLNTGEASGPGVSVIAEVATSHVAVHTWPERDLLTLDVYSCRAFDPTGVVDLVERFFEPYAWHVRETVARFGVDALLVRG